MWLTRLAERLSSVEDAGSNLLEQCYADPVRFVLECFTWREGEGPTFYQCAALADLPVHRRVSVRGPHGLGKTTLNSWAILWFALTRDATDTEWKVPTTASSWRQLTHFLWPEVHKWARRLRWDRLNREPFDARIELQTLSLKLRTGEAFASASDKPELIEGAHADSLLYVFDESKVIKADTFDAAEGAFSGTGEAFGLATSTPGEPNGRFYEIQSRKPGFEDWKVHAVTLDDTIRAGRVSPTWAEQRRKQWGEKSAVFQNRVLGEFASSDEDGVIPLSWIEAANERWRQWDEEGRPGRFISVGVDVARSGEDKTVLALRFDGDDLKAIAELRRYAKEDTMATTGYVAGVLNAHGGRAVVDVIGIGAGVVDRLREQKLNVVAFNASEGTDRKDRSGELGFTNKRSAAWWNLREMLDPSNGDCVALPPDDLLTGDLTAPHWRVMSGGRIQVEAKEDIKERIGRSTDDGDATVQAFWSDSKRRLRSL